jgi:hypothetical protein
MRQIPKAGGFGSILWLAVMSSLLLFGFIPSAIPQGGGNAAITGTVVDPQGAVVSGAQVTVTQLNTAVKRTITTNGAGQFNVPSLPPARYMVSVTAAGFKGYEENGIVLLADQIRDLDIHLDIGQTSQHVTVEASSVQVNTSSPVLGQVIEQSRLVDIPLNGRNAADLTLLVPGAINLSANNAGTQQGDTKQVPGAEAISVNGTRPDQIGYNLDGADNEDLMSNTNNPFPFPDALQEFSVQTNSFDAQYGNNAGAVVNVVTKSGTNDWHGDAFEFVRNRVFNARNYFASSKDPLKRNQFGATIGGPIHKNTTFIFGGWQKTIIRSANAASNGYVPLPANLNGDFSNYSTLGASNPKGKVVNIINPYTHTAYSSNSNIGPLDPVALKMTSLMPISSESSSGFVTYATPIRQNFDEYIVRFDQVFRGQDRLFGRFYLDRYVHAPTYDGKNILTAGPGSTVQTQNWALGYTRVFSPHVVNTLILDIVRSASDRGQGGNVPQMTDFGSSIFQLPKSQGGIRNFGVSGDFTLGNFTDGKFIRNTGNLRELVDWTKGKHDFTFGYDLELDQSNINNTDFENGNFNFTDDVSGLAMANFLLGYEHTFSQTSGDFSDSRENPMSVYGNDKWKVSPRLTLDYGLRWEPQQVMKEIWGRIEQFWPDAWGAGVHSSIVPSAPPGLFFVGDKYNGKSVPATGETGDYNNFAPRVGIAWDPTGNGKMSLRAGGGLFYYSRLPGLFLNDAAISAPFSLRIDLNDSTTGASQIGSLANPEVNYPSFTTGFPQRYILKNVPKNATFVANPTVFGLQPGVKWVTPEIYDWNVTYEYQVRSDTVAHVSYVGTRGTHLRQDVNLNPGFYTAGSTASLQARRPYQPFGIIYQNRNSGANGYNGLQIDLEKRPAVGVGFLNHITLLANYTYSKAMDYGLAENGGITDIGSSLGSGMSFYDPRQHAFETGPSVLDHRHRFVASFVWSLPRMTGSNGFVRNTVGGWQWTGIYSYISGDPLTILAGTDQSQTGNNLDRADYVGPANQFGKMAPSSQRGGCSGTVPHCVAWLNPTSFAKPALGTYGNSGKGNWRGPDLQDVDTGLLKNFNPVPSHENISFQLRGEFFNLFNHPQLADPNLTYSNGAFGSVRATVGTNADYRIVQLAMKMLF